MPTRPVARGLRIDSKSPANEVEIPASSGMSRFKRVMYAVKVVDASATTDDYTLRIEHSPDGTLWETHTVAPILADAGTVRTFASDATKVLGEFVHAVVVTNAATGWLELTHELLQRRSGSRRLDPPRRHESVHLDHPHPADQ